MKKFVIPFVCVAIAIKVSMGTNGSTNQQNAAQSLTIQRVDVEQFAKRVSEEGAAILDVRTAPEFNSGHIKSAINLDFHAFDFDSSLSKLDKSKTWLVYCAGGARSSLVCKKMSQMGFLNVIDLAPGFSGWKQAKMPVEK